MALKWYILQFKPNSEKIAVRNLNQQGFETFLPLESATSYKISSSSNYNRPLFPGYMFVACEASNLNWTSINSTYGVSRLVASGLRPLSVSNKIITELMLRCDDLGRLLPQKKLQKNDTVRILKGPFSDFLAKVVSTDANQRIWILMDIMGRKTRLQINSNELHLQI